MNESITSNIPVYHSNVLSYVTILTWIEIDFFGKSVVILACSSPSGAVLILGVSFGHKMAVIKFKQANSRPIGGGNAP